MQPSSLAFTEEFFLLARPAQLEVLTGVSVGSWANLFSGRSASLSANSLLQAAEALNMQPKALQQLCQKRADIEARIEACVAQFARTDAKAMAGTP
jgi:transcriptional regulator with XRE-family HTH domain